MHSSKLVQAGFFVNGCVGQGNGHRLKSDFIREGRGKALLTERLALGYPKMILCSRAQPARLPMCLVPVISLSQPHTGVAFLGSKVNS